MRKREKQKKEVGMGLENQCIRFDWAIKRLLRQKANFGVLEGFLTVLIAINYTLKISSIA